MTVIGKGGPIFKFLTADRCSNCNTVIENIRGRWFHLNSFRTNCKESEKIANPQGIITKVNNDGTADVLFYKRRGES